MFKILVFVLFSFTFTQSLIISEYSEGSSYNKYIEIYNPTDSAIDLSDYQIWKISNGGDWEEGAGNGLDLSGSLASNDVYVVCHSSIDEGIASLCDILSGTQTVNFNGDDAVGLAYNLELIDQIGDAGNDPGNGWEVSGISDATKDHTLVRKSNILIGNTDWGSSAGSSSEDSEWEVYPQNTWTFLGWHIEGGDDIITGCTDLDATNYNPDATLDDGSCEYESLELSIYDIQGQTDDSPYINHIVSTTGVVTGVAYNGFFFQDGMSEWSGIWAYGASDNLALGDLVAVTGTVVEYNNLTEIDVMSVLVVSSNNELPNPIILDTGDIGESYESVLVNVIGTAITSPNEYGEWSVDDGSGSTWVDDKLFAEADESIELGNQYVVVGPVDFTYGNYKIQPRSEADVFQFFQEGIPIADAGDDQLVDFSSIVTLDGSGSYDSDGILLGYNWTQTSGPIVNVDNSEQAIITFTAPDEFCTIEFSLQVYDDEFNFSSLDYISITVGSLGITLIDDIIHNCGDDAGESLSCDGQYDLSSETASQCPLYGQPISTTGVIVDYFDITPFGGPFSFTIQDSETGGMIDFIVWPTSSSYQDGFDITQTDLNVLTQEPFGIYEVQITGELGAYCDDDELLDIYTEWQMTVEYESDITILGQNDLDDFGCTDPSATNYDENAIIDDGSCVYPGVEGTIDEIIHNCGDDAGESLSCDGQYDLSSESASQCPFYEQSVTTTGVVIDYFDITPFGGPFSFTIQDNETGGIIDFVVWPTSSSYQDGFDITQTDLNILTQEPFGVHEIEITGELGAYCDDDELLDIYTEWQITVEYESDITILGDCTSNGDVNFDDNTDILDVVSIVGYILGNNEFDNNQLCASDLNQDSNVDILDIVSIVSIILGNI